MPILRAALHQEGAPQTHQRVRYEPSSRTAAHGRPDEPHSQRFKKEPGDHVGETDSTREEQRPPRQALEDARDPRGGRKSMHAVPTWQARRLLQESPRTRD